MVRSTIELNPVLFMFFLYPGTTDFLIGQEVLIHFLHQRP